MNGDLRQKLTYQLLKAYPNLTQADVMFSFCPYRVCPVGAHIDHQKGNVTGFAINYGITIAYVPSKNHFFEATSLNFTGTKGDNITDIGPKKGDWADYIRGTAKILHDHHHITQGIYCVIDGSLPIGGISSSAAVIIAFMKALCTVNGVQLEKSEVVRLSQEVENSYVGVNSGTLDQSCELYSKKDHLLYLDTSNGKYKLIPKRESSIYNYEAGSPELKTIHEILSQTEGVYGGRFSGAGFKGCCLAIINPEYAESIRKKITYEYLKQFQQYKDSFEIFFCETADGCDF